MPRTVEGSFAEQLTAFKDKLKARVEDGPVIANLSKDRATQLRKKFLGLGGIWFIRDLSRLDREAKEIEARTRRYDQTFNVLDDIVGLEAESFAKDHPRAFHVTAQTVPPKSGSSERKVLSIDLEIPLDYNPSKASRTLVFQANEKTSTDKLLPISAIRAAALADPYTRIVHELFFQNPQPATEVTPQPGTQTTPQPVLA